MKKSTIIAALFISFTSIVMAQERDNRENLRVGLKAGLNYSNVYDETGDSFNADAKFGLAGGIFLAIPIGKYLGIQPEVLVSQKGFQGTGMLLGSPYSFTRTTTYIDVPLQLAFKPSEFISLLAGPQYSYLIKQRDVFTNSASSLTQEQEFEQDNIRKNIFGVVGGMDINLRHVVLSSRVSWDVQNNNGDGSSYTPRYKNVWLQQTIGFAF